MLWHRRLGHPNFSYMKVLYPDLFTNKENFSFQCEHCVLAKQTQVPYPVHAYLPTKPFQLIHSDIWGPSRTISLTRTQWFITFTDDHTRACWVYLMKDKSEAFFWFKQFHKFVQNVFQSAIQILRTDNGGEYFSNEFSQYLGEIGIHHQSSCVDTPKQNGVAERKNRHLLEVARSIMFASSVPNSYWGEAILTATYLINRLPSKTLKFRTPLSVLRDCFQNINIFNPLLPKVFGCTVFVHNNQPTRSKLDPRAFKCVFVGYSPTKKGYKCYSPVLKKFFVSCDVTFFEEQLYYPNNLSKGENSNEKVHWDPSVSFPITQDIQVHKDPSVSFPTTQDIPHFLQTTNSVPANPENVPNLICSDPNNIPDSENSNQQISETSLNPSEPFSTSSPGPHKKDFVTETPLQVYSRRPKTLQQDQLSSRDSDNEMTNDLDWPIAVRKGVRACTKHPIYNFLTYKQLSSEFKAFTAKVDEVEIPKNIYEALKDPRWKEAVQEEMRALQDNRTWEMIDLPEGKKVVGSRWVFTVKYKANGEVERYKARLVAQGYTQTYGIDYDETFAPVAKLNSIRVLLSIAANLDWKLHQLDIKNAFLNGNLDEEVYMKVPPGFEVQERKGKVCKLKKSLYGLKQSPRAWFTRFSSTLTRLGYHQARADHTVFIKIGKAGQRAVLIVYVDDIILTGDDEDELHKLKDKLKEEFEVKDLGPLKYFLGMEVARSKEGIFISQRKYILDLLKETGKLGCKPVGTPLEKAWRSKFSGKEEPVDVGRYQRLVGRLIYLSLTRPDIAYAVSVVSQYMHSPTQRHLEAVNHILRYLKGTVGQGLMFLKTENRSIEGYVDADWAGSEDCKSTSGYCTKLWGNLVTWRSKKQTVVARSSAEAEFRAIAQGVCEVIWLERLMQDLQLAVSSPKLYSDSKSAISIVNNPVQHDRMKHVRIDRSFIKNEIEQGGIDLCYISTHEQEADVLTKSLLKSNHEGLLRKLGMRNIYS